MNRKIAFLAGLIFLLTTSYATAGVNVPYSTTFDCPEWDGGTGDKLSCDNLEKYGSWSTSDNRFQQITSEANYPGGDGGRGMRKWIGNGTNNNSGSVRIRFNSAQKKFWMRWYQRWEPGFTSNWHTYKNIWFEPNSGGRFVFHTGRPGIGGIDLNPPDANTEVRDVAYASSFYKGGTSDGSWQYFEVLIDLPGSVFKAWVNGALVKETSGVNYGASTVTYIDVGVNAKDVSNPRSMYIDYDDIVISTSGYIGPVDGGGNGGTPEDTTPPTVAITSPNDGATVTGIIDVTADASDNVGVVGVQFKINDKNLGGEATVAPYTVSLEPGDYVDGAYTLTAVASDAAGNQAESSAVNVTISDTDDGGGPPVGGAPEGDLLIESFENDNLAAQGWYDNTGGQVFDAAEYAPTNGSTQSLQYRYAAGATTPDSGGAVRRKLATPSDEIYVQYWVKYSSGFQGSGTGSHPHEFFILSDQDADWNSPNNSSLQVKIEQNALRPRVIFRDDKMVNTSYGTPPQDLVGVTENRAVHGCNGQQDGYLTDCYQSGGTWYNAKHILADSPVISDNTWHKVGVYIKFNTISGGTTNADGIMKYWLDDTIVFDYSDLVMRTSERPTIMMNQLGIAPFIGGGSPVEQTFWVDEITISSEIPSQEPGQPLSAPTDFRLAN